MRLEEQFSTQDGAAINYERLYGILSLTAARYGVALGDLFSQCRSASVVRPRHVAMYLTRVLTALSYPEVGDLFGGRDHSTTIHACNRIRELRTQDIVFDRVLHSLTGEILAVQ